jgi:hypothetical protein
MARSELGRDVTVDLQANAYFNENWGRPRHDHLLSFQAVEFRVFRSLCRGFGQDQPLGACPAQSVVGGRSSRARGPAAGLDEFSLLPARRNGFQGNQVRRRIGVVLEFLHTDRREDRHDGCIGALIRKLARGVAGHPAAPVEPDERENDCSAYRAPTSRFDRGRNMHDFRLCIGGHALKTAHGGSECGCRWHPRRMQLYLECYCARRWHQRRPLEGTETSVRPRFMAALGQATACL